MTTNAGQPVKRDDGGGVRQYNAPQLRMDTWNELQVRASWLKEYARSGKDPSEPRALVAEALDVLVQDQVLRLLRDLQQEYGLSYLFISHDLAVVRLISDYVCVMKDGALVEAASSEEIFTNPRDPYTRRLLASIPGNELDIAV